MEHRKQKMLPLRAALLLLGACWTCSGLETRTGEVLGSAKRTDPGSLWPVWDGPIRWAIVTNESVGGVEPLQANETRVFKAIEHWEEKTCMRFQHCATEDDCKTPYFRFRAHSSRCRAPFGNPGVGKVSTISLAPKCPLWATIHEIGHVMGLAHEQTRNDRDNHVKVIEENVKKDRIHNFRKNGPLGRDLGAYDVKSIMQYNSVSFSIQRPKPTLIKKTGELIRQQSVLSPGDVATIDFMYNSCSNRFERPRCMVSWGEEVQRIPYGQEWAVEFNVLYKEGGNVSVWYNDTTTPEYTASLDEGQWMGRAGKVLLQFTPEEEDVGRRFILASTFKASDGPTATCLVEVEVAAATTTCFGVVGDDSACNGVGKCIAEDVCKCDEGWFGTKCEQALSCPGNNIYPLDGSSPANDSGTFEVDGAFSYDTTYFTEGSASLKLEEGTFKANYTRITPTRISFDFSLLPGDSNLLVEAESFYFQAFPRIILFGVSAFPVKVELQPRRFYHVDVDIDHLQQTQTLWLDGMLLIADLPEESGGITELIVEGTAWVDSMRLLCENYVKLSGSAVEKPISQTDLVAGGLTFTATIVGNNTWVVDTQERKQHFISHLQGTLFAGWNRGTRAQVLTPDLVEVDGNDTRVLRVGPLRPFPTVNVAPDEKVFVKLEPSMFAQAPEPDALGETGLSLSIKGKCSKDQYWTFDDVPNQYLSLAQRGSYAFPTAPGSLEMEAASFSFRVLRTREAQDHWTDLSVMFHHDSGEIEIRRGEFGYKLLVNGQEYPFKGNNTVDVWIKVEVSFTIFFRRLEVSIDGAKVKLEGDLEAFKEIPTMHRIYAQADGPGVYLDDLGVRCRQRLPLSENFVPCKEPGPLRMVVKPGSVQFMPNDTLLVMSPDAPIYRPCESEARVVATTESTGEFEVVDENGVWTADNLTSAFVPGKRHTLCHYSTLANQWFEVLGKITVCLPPTTTAPDTPSPPTLTPDTASPPTSAPATPSPPTLTPDTPSPPTSAPATSSPPTLTPAILAPRPSPTVPRRNPRKKSSPRRRGYKNRCPARNPYRGCGRCWEVRWQAMICGY